MKLSLNPRNLRISTKITISLGVVSILPILILAQLGASQISKLAQEDGKLRLSSLAEATSMKVDAEIKANIELSTAIATDAKTIEFAAHPNLDPVLREEILARLDNFKASYPGAGIFYIIGTDGVVSASSDRLVIGNNYSFRKFFKKAMEGEANVSDVYFPINTTSPKPGTAFITPIRSEGVIVGAVTIKSDAITVPTSKSIRKNSEILIVERTGIISSHPQERLRFKSLRRLTAAEQTDAADGKRFKGAVKSIESSESIKQLIGTNKAAFAIGSIDHKQISLAWRPLKGTDWAIAAIEPVAIYSAAATKEKRLALTVVVTVAIAALLFGVIIARSLSHPISQLTLAATALKGGLEVDNAALKKVANRGDDLGILAASLADAARETLERTEKLHAQVRRMTIEINAERRKEEVVELTEADFFSDIQSRGAQMRQQRIDDGDPPKTS